MSKQVVKETKRAIRSGFKSLLSDAAHSDLTITAGPPLEDETSDHNTFKVHRCIVTINSEFFKRACSNTNFKEGQECLINLPEIQPHILSHVLSFLYSGEYDQTGLTTHAQVFSAAVFLGIPLLAKCAVSRISQAVEISKERFLPLPEQTQKDFAAALDIIYTDSSELDREAAGVSLLCEDMYTRSFQWSEEADKLFDEILTKHGSLGRDILRQVKKSTVKEERYFHYCGCCKTMSQSVLQCNSAACLKIPHDENKPEDISAKCPCCGRWNGYSLVCLYCKEKKDML